MISMLGGKPTDTLASEVGSPSPKHTKGASSMMTDNLCVFTLVMPSKLINAL